MSKQQTSFCAVTGLPNITVNARKMDGEVHRSWKCKLVRENPELWEFVGIFETEIRHPLLGVIRPETVSYEFYWKTRCYNVFRFHEPEGDLRNFYCNVNLPPVFEEGVLNYVDLDIDILVAPDFSFQVLDMEEFQENVRKYDYSPEIVAKAKTSLTKLIELIEKRHFPFDFEI